LIWDFPKNERSIFIFLTSINRKALSKFSNNIPRATEYLLNDNEGSEEAKSPSNEAPQAIPHFAGIQNLFAELLKRGPRPDREDDPPDENDNGDNGEGGSSAT